MNEEGEVIYEISSHTSKLIDWVVSLKKKITSVLNQKFKTLFSQLKELVKTNDRMNCFEPKKMEIESFAWNEEVEVYEDYQIELTYNSLNKLAKELLKRNNFIIEEIYERQTEK